MDGRSSTPGSRRTRSSLAPRTLLVDATVGAARPRPGRDERRVDRRRRPGCAMFPGLFGPAVAADVRASRPRRILAVALEIADRGDQVRDQLRGALVEELTAETLLARRVGRGAGPPRATDPVRRGPGRDPSLRRDGRARRRGRGVGLQVGRARHLGRRPPPARRRPDATPPTRTSAARRAGRVRRRAVVPRPPGAAHRADGGTAIVALEALDRAGRRDAVSDGVLGAVPGPLRRGRSGRAGPHVGAAALRPGPRLAALGRAGLRSGVVPPVAA